MSNETTKTAVPKLRFPEFWEAGEWEEKVLGELFSERQENGFIELPLLSLTDKEGIIPQEESNRRNTSNSDKGKYLRVCLGDIAYNTMRMWEGRSAFVNREGIISPAYTVCTPKDVVDGLFFSYYFKTQQLVQQFHKYSQGLVKDTLNLKFVTFSRIKILSPVKPEEQQKIAATLSSLDDLITAESARLAALQAHKRGLMQGLFPAEGETVPMLRFLEFEGAGEWEEKSLGQSLSNHPEYGINAAAVPFSDGLPAYLRITDISDDGRFSCDKKVSVEKEVKGDNYLTEGDIVLARTGASVGKSYKYRVEDGELVFAGFLIRVRPNKNKLAPEFLSQFLSTEQYWRWVAFTCTRSGQPGINGNEYASMPLPLPPTLAEQLKIAAALSSLDALITAQSQKIAALKLHKKGLMQGLFPSSVRE